MKRLVLVAVLLWLPASAGSLLYGVAGFSRPLAAQPSPSLRLYVFDGGVLESDPGRYRLKLTYFEQGNGAELELYAARGAFDTYEAGALPTGVALPPPEPGTDVPEPAATLVILFAVGIRLLGRVTRHPPSPALR